MTMEVSCGSCNGRLLVETPGVIVVCPHCGIHLSIPEQGSSNTSETSSVPATNSESNQSLPATTEERQAMTPLNRMPSEASRAETAVYTGSPNVIPKSSPVLETPSSIFHSPEDDSPVTISSENGGWLSSPNLSLTDADKPGLERFEKSPADDEPSADEEIPAIDTVSFPEMETTTTPPNPPVGFANSESINEAGIADPAQIEPSNDGFEKSWVAPAHVESSTPALSFGEFGVGPSNDDAVSANLDSLAEAKPAEAFAEVVPSENVVSSAVSGPAEESISRLTFLLMIVGSYASLLTIVLIYLYFFVRAHQLESLPDLKTVQQLGGRAAVPKPENNLPPGHELRFGQSQRYGNVRVTPLRVTRGPISFEHQSGDKSEERTPSEPVLKLWLKFENVSTKEAITPLDTTLMFFRRVLDHRIASYNVIFREADRNQKNPQLWYPFNRMAVDTEWMIVGQHTNQPLESRDSFETFIPSEEELDGLTGEIVWRVHFRKGYGPKTGNGVTTLVDVHFNSDDIKPDAT